MAHSLKTLLALTILLAAHARADAQVQARIVRVGLSGGGTPAVREGDPTTVTVELKNLGSTIFDGELHVEQTDRDGDVVVATVQQVVLSPNSPDWRPISVYFVPSFVTGQAAVQISIFDKQGQVELLDDRGQRQRFVASVPLDRIKGNETVILEVTSPGQRRLAAHLHYMDNPGYEIARDRKIRIRSIETSALPTRWHGLASADVIAWDDPDVSALQADQLQAVVQWVRQGGRLLISSGRHWDAMSRSPLADLLPVRISGVRQSTQRVELPRLVHDLTPAASAFLTDDQVPRCQMQPRGTIPGGIFSYPSGAEKDPLAYRRLFGRGVVTFVGAPLRELLGPLPVPKGREPDSPWDEAGDREYASDEYRDSALSCRQLLQGLLPVPDPPRAGDDWPGQRDLYSPVAAQIGFSQNAGMFLMASVLFALAYGAFAIFATWWWLGRRNWRHHAWTGFAVVAALGIVLASLAVWSLRGFKKRVNDVQVVDAWANQSSAQSQALFGLRTPAHTRVTLRLPTAGFSDDQSDDLGPIFALPANSDDLDSVHKYVAPATYEMDRAGRELRDVAIRATLKEFSGCYQGTLGGQLDARLVMKNFRLSGGGPVDRIVAPSFIRNNLKSGTDLRDCILFVTSHDSVSRPRDVNYFSLGTLSAGAEFRDFDTWFRKTKDLTDEERADPDLQWLPAGRLPHLGEQNGGIQKWGNDFRSLWGAAVDVDYRGPKFLSGPQTALLLLSLFDLYSPEQSGVQAGTSIMRSSGHRLGFVHQLTRHSAILVGFCDTSGPAEMEVNGQTIRSSKSLTMYRFMIPVERQ